MFDARLVVEGPSSVDYDPAVPRETARLVTWKDLGKRAFLVGLVGHSTEWMKTEHWTCPAAGLLPRKDVTGK
jgi:hypothetical protein